MDYKRKYLNIWEQFENNIRSAAYTSSLPKFVNTLCSKSGMTLGRNADERAVAERILQAGQDRAMLKLMRDETTYLVLLVRVAVQERRAAYQSRSDAIAEEALVEAPLFEAGEDDENLPV